MRSNRTGKSPVRKTTNKPTDISGKKQAAKFKGKDSKGESSLKEKGSREERSFKGKAPRDDSKFKRTDSLVGGKFAGKESKIEHKVIRTSKPATGKVQNAEKPAARPIVKRGYKLDEKIRLNRYLSNSGVCSRREADVFISTGCVTVNGKIVSELGTKVSLNDDVRFNGQPLMPERKVYLLLNKPKGYVTTTDDPQERKTVMDLIHDACPERIYPVGRLDRETTGLLLFTNDGDIAKKLTHPSHSKKKIYQVSLDKPLTKNDLLKIAKGIELEDGFIAADSINYIDEEDKREIGIEIHSGWNRVVRRIFEHLGYDVVKLDRVFFAGLTKKNLPRSKWRFLTQAEINQLKML